MGRRAQRENAQEAVNQREISGNLGPRLQPNGAHPHLVFSFPRLPSVARASCSVIGNQRYFLLASINLVLARGPTRRCLDAPMLFTFVKPEIGFTGACNKIFITVSLIIETAAISSCFSIHDMKIEPPALRCYKNWFSDPCALRCAACADMHVTDNLVPLFKELGCGDRGPDWLICISMLFNSTIGDIS
jgi:hypothetical protein